MQMTKAERFNEICNRLQAAECAFTFQGAHELFSSTFRGVEMQFTGSYSQERGQSNKHLYFYEYYKQSPYWRLIDKMYVMEGNKHYVVFGEDGGFVIYSRSGTLFGDIVLDKSAKQAINGLTGRHIFDLNKKSSGEMNETREDRR